MRYPGFPVHLGGPRLSIDIIVACDPTKGLRIHAPDSLTTKDCQCGNNSRSQQEIAATIALSTLCFCYLPLISNFAFPCVWHVCTDGGSCVAKRSPAGMQQDIQIAVEDRSSRVASTSRRPQPHSHRRTPDHACIAGPPQKTMTFIA